MWFPTNQYHHSLFHSLSLFTYNRLLLFRGHLHAVLAGPLLNPPAPRANDPSNAYNTYWPMQNGVRFKHGQTAILFLFLHTNSKVTTVLNSINGQTNKVCPVAGADTVLVYLNDTSNHLPVPSDIRNRREARSSCSRREKGERAAALLCFPLPRFCAIALLDIRS